MIHYSVLFPSGTLPSIVVPATTLTRQFIRNIKQCVHLQQNSLFSTLVWLKPARNNVI